MLPRSTLDPAEFVVLEFKHQNPRFKTVLDCYIADSLHHPVKINPISIFYRPLFGKVSLIIQKDISTIEFIGALRHMQRYFSHICDGTDVQADWRRSCTYGRAPNAIDITQGSLTCPS